MKRIAIALLILAAIPVSDVVAAEATGFNFSEMAVFVGINGILGLGVFAIGVILVGLLVDKFKPWINSEGKSDHRSHEARPHTHHFPATSLDDAISRERRDVY